jgi:hypothetical protein
LVISVTAPQCGDAECGGAETIILLMRPDEPTQAIKISKSLETVTQSDVAEALQPLLYPGVCSAFAEPLF